MLETKRINVKHTVVEGDVWNQTVPPVLETKRINVKHTVAEGDVWNQTVPPVLLAKRINVQHTVAEGDVLIALIGLIVGVDKFVMTDTVRLVSNKFSQTILAARWYMLTPRKSW